MRSNQLNDEIIGRRIASPVYSIDGKLLLSRGTVVNYKILSKLENHDVDTDDLLDSLTEGIKPLGLLINNKWLSLLVL